jgi:peptidoglycan glycosyltransferase
MNKPLRRVAVACLALFALLLLNANYQQFVLASERRDDPANRRVLLEEYSTQRGPILVAGQPIARSEATSDELKYQRVYADGPLYAPVTGYYSFIYGASGIEAAEREILAGTDDRLFVRRVADLFTGDKPGGGTVRLTLNPAAQQAAYAGLQGQVGAVVAIAPQTGAILAMVTNPSYDPNVLSSHNGTAIQEAWQMLNADPAKPMANRALRETYPPGSTFKIITAAAALSTGKYTSESVVPAPDVLDLPLTDADLPNQGGASCSSTGQITIRDALRISCNTAFGGLGMAIGADALQEQAEKFGFNSTVDVPMRSARSVFPSDLNAPQTAQSAIGQFDVRATPLQMAMMIAGVANDGVVMKPYLVQEVDAPDLTPLETAEPEQLSQAVSPAVAEQLQSMLVTVVQDGTGRNAQIDGVTVGGKTGTAQSAPDRPPYAWFVAFGPVENPQVAVAVLIESANVEPNDISGGRLAAPIAKAVMEAVLGS